MSICKKEVARVSHWSPRTGALPPRHGREEAMGTHRFTGNTHQFVGGSITLPVLVLDFHATQRDRPLFTLKPSDDASSQSNILLNKVIEK